jgi:hypothetical protein
MDRKGRALGATPSNASAIHAIAGPVVGTRGVFAKRVAIWMFGPGRVKGSPIADLRRQRRSGARLRGKQGAAVHR